MRQQYGCASLLHKHSLCHISRASGSRRSRIYTPCSVPKQHQQHIRLEQAVLAGYPTEQLLQLLHKHGEQLATLMRTLPHQRCLTYRVADLYFIAICSLLSNSYSTVHACLMQYEARILLMAGGLMHTQQHACSQMQGNTLHCK